MGVVLIRLLLILSFLLVFNPLVVAGTSVDYDDANCQAAWLMDTDVGAGALPDSSQNTNTGQVKGDGEPDFATASPPAAYSTGYYVWDGSDDVVTVTWNASLALTGDWAYTIWAKRDDTGAHIDPLFSHWTSNVAQRQIYIYYTDAPDDDTIRVDIPFIANTLSGGTSVVDGAWHHIAVVKSGTTWTLYLDGVSDDSAVDATAQEATTDQPLEIGAQTSTGTADQFFNGDLDEAAIFDRVLDSTEINDIMDNGLAPAVAGVIKTYNGLAWASVKTIDGLAVASVKTINGAAAQ